MALNLGKRWSTNEEATRGGCLGRWAFVKPQALRSGRASDALATQLPLVFGVLVWWVCVDFKSFSSGVWEFLKSVRFGLNSDWCFNSSFEEIVCSQARLVQAVRHIAGCWVWWLKLFNRLVYPNLWLGIWHPGLWKFLQRVWTEPKILFSIPFSWEREREREALNLWGVWEFCAIWFSGDGFSLDSVLVFRKVPEISGFGFKFSNCSILATSTDFAEIAFVGFKISWNLKKFSCMGSTQCLNFLRISSSFRLSVQNCTENRFGGMRIREWV